MIFLKQNNINDIALTLNEKNPLTGITSGFTFNFTHTDTNTQVSFYGVDISSCPNRFNRFNITVTGSTFIDLSASTVSLLNGFHTYTVTNISGNTLETGMVLVSGATATIPQFEISPTKTKKIYER